MLKCSLPRQLNTGKSTPSAEVWILIRLGDAEIGARLIDASDRIPKIVVLDEGGSNQLLELFVREDLEPFEIRNRRRRPMSSQREIGPGWRLEGGCSLDRPYSRSNKRASPSLR